jgi:hypothetical protein
MAKKDEQRKKRKLNERSRKFQDTWMTKLPWIEFVFDEKGEVQQVRCRVYTYVEGKQKLLATKLDSLLKHQSCQKAKVLMQDHYTSTKKIYMLIMNVFTLPMTTHLFWTTSK